MLSSTRAGAGDDHEAFGVGLELLDQTAVGGARRVDVQGGGSGHGGPRLCGGEMRQLNSMFILRSMQCVYFLRKIGFPLSRLLVG